MTTLLFSLALVVLIVVSFVMAMKIKYLYKEIDRLENIFDYHKRIHKYERLVAEQKIKEFKGWTCIHPLTAKTLKNK